MQRLSDISTIRAVMEKNGFSFSKALGQNFLINPSVCPRMAEMSGAADCAGAIEVGPGIGVLTYELSQVSKKVVTIELDKRLLPVLDETLADCDNVKVINDDVMKIDLHRVIEEEFNGEEVRRHTIGSCPFLLLKELTIITIIITWGLLLGVRTSEVHSKLCGLGELEVEV